MFGQESVVAPGKHVDNGIADGDNIKRGGSSSHAKSFVNEGENPAVSIDPARGAQRR